MAHQVAEVITEALGGIELAQRNLREVAPRAVAVLTEVANDETVPAASRVRAAESLLRASGASLERVDVAVAVSQPSDAARVVAERLDRLAAGLASDGSEPCPEESLN